MIHRLFILMEEKCIRLMYELKSCVQRKFIAVPKGLERKLFAFAFTPFFCSEAMRIVVLNTVDWDDRPNY
jgi:hypothetical protein